MGKFTFERILNPLPPIGLGSFVVNIPINSEKAVTPADFNSMQPPFNQIDGAPLWRIKIIGYGSDRDNFLSKIYGNTGYLEQLASLCAISNSGGFYPQSKTVGYTESGDIVNNEFQMDTVEDTMILKSGSTPSTYLDYVTFVAKSIFNGHESEWSTVTGRMYINVTDSTNNPPIQTGTKHLKGLINQPIQIPLSFFKTTSPTYQDPEGDDILKIKVQTLPNNVTILFNNTPVVVGQEIMASDINQGALKYIIQPNGTLSDFKWDVADVGSGQYSGL